MEYIVKHRIGLDVVKIFTQTNPAYRWKFLTFACGEYIEGGWVDADERKWMKKNPCEQHHRFSNLEDVIEFISGLDCDSANVCRRALVSEI